VAVLPFADRSPAQDQEYFTDGLTEELINALAKLPDLRVAGRTSSFQFKDQTADLREIGEKLNVSTILEGSVRKAGDQVRISAQLVNVEDGFQLWSETYDRTLEDIFAVQDEIANSVASALQVELLGEGRTTPQEANAEAYNLLLQAREARWRTERRPRNCCSKRSSSIRCRLRIGLSSVCLMREWPLPRTPKKISRQPLVGRVGRRSALSRSTPTWPPRIRASAGS
jgi:TolB-like protein